MTDSIFAKIARGEAPAEKVYEDADVVAFLDISPTNRGHTLVVPKKQYENMYDLPEDLFLKVMAVVKKLSLTIRDAMRAEGINILINNEPAAGQIVNHAHVHIIPRFPGDGHHHWKGAPYGPGEATRVAAAIRAKV